MLGDLAGTTALREELSTTNSLLAQVLAELKTTNDRRLEAVVGEMREMNAALAALTGGEGLGTGATRAQRRPDGG